MLPLNGHYCTSSCHYSTTIVPQLCYYVATWMPLVATNVPLWGHNIGIVLQLNGHCNAIMWPLIKYYQFTIHIKCEFVDLKLDPMLHKLY